MSPVSALAITAVLFSTGGAAIKWCQFGAWQLAGVRAGVACTTLLLLLPETRRGWTCAARCSWERPTRRPRCLVRLVQQADHRGQHDLPAESAPIFHTRAPAPWLLHEHVRRQDIGYMAPWGSVMALFFAGTPRAFATAPNRALGNLLAATCAVTWALTLIGYRWLVRGAEPGAHPWRARRCAAT